MLFFLIIHQFFNKYFHQIGTDELSAAFTELINSDVIRQKLESEDFVAIKVRSDGEAYMQFAQICKFSRDIDFNLNLMINGNICMNFFRFTDKLVPLPSLFFIGKTGTPIEIVTSVTKTVDELKSKIDKVLNLVKPTTSDTAAASSANLISSILNAFLQRDGDCVDESLNFHRFKSNFR